MKENYKDMETTKTQFLDFEKSKVQTLTLDQLERTYKENDVYGNPLRGIYHYTLIQKILTIARGEDYTPEVYDLFAAQNKDRNTPGVVLLPQVEAQVGQRAVEAHILRRVYANIRLTDLDNEEMTTNIAVAFHQRGVQVGFGNMVKICHNQCMLNAEHYAATYGERGQGRGKGMCIDDICETIGTWLSNARHTIVEEREKIEAMKHIEVPAEQMYTIIGMLTAMRVAADTKNKEIRSQEVYPLNQAQITLFTELMLMKYHEAQRITAWDLYNGATELYKATSVEIPALLPQNKAMAEFIFKQFNI